MCDTLKGKRTDVFATELNERTKALFHTHNIQDPDARIRHKQRKMEDFVLETTSESDLDELAKHYSTDLKTEEVLVARNFF